MVLGLRCLVRFESPEDFRESMEFNEPFALGGEQVKLWSSCVRRQSFRQALEATTLVERNATPRDGDLVLVRVLSEVGAYGAIDDLHGRSVKLYAGDTFVGVLAARQSGTNVTGVVPERALGLGDRLDYLAMGGLVGVATGVPSYLGGVALPLQVRGFPTWRGHVANLRDACDDVTTTPPPRSPRAVVVAGTSAEVGKTTAVCSLIRGLRASNTQCRVGVVKACGTGRTLDCLKYADAGAVFVADFVDTGLASTYGVSVEAFHRALWTNVRRAIEASDLLVVEIGGDLVEGHASEMLSIAASWGAPAILCVSDAHGASDALRRLHEQGIARTMVATFRQNELALASRLSIDRVVSTRNYLALAELMNSPADETPFAAVVGHRAAGP